MSNTNTVAVSILQKEYKIACPEEQQDALIRSAAMVDRKMREIREQGKSIGQDRVAIMAAINIAYELLDSQSSHSNHSGEISKELSRIHSKVEGALFQGRQLELG